MFIIPFAISPQALATLYNSYQTNVPNTTITNLYNIWYDNTTICNNNINVRAYFQYQLYNNTPSPFVIPNYNSNIYYTNALFIFNKLTNKYIYIPSNDILVTSSSNGLTTENLATLTLYYPITKFNNPCNNQCNNQSNNQCKKSCKY